MPDIDLQFALLAFGSLTISLVLHEFAHAFVADKLGDPTPRDRGYLTLSPVIHWRNEPIGTLVAPIIGAVTGFLVGWAWVPVNPHLVDRRWSLRQAEFMIAAAGPVMNMILAVICAGLFHAVVGFGIKPLSLFLLVMVSANLFLAFFNLIPVPPLDGYTVLCAVAPQSWTPALEKVREFSLLIFALLIFRGGDILGPPISFFSGLLLGR